MFLVRELSVSFMSGVSAVNWRLETSCRKVRATALLPCAGEGLIESQCCRAEKCPVRALFSLSRIDDGSSLLMIIIWCTCTCTVQHGLKATEEKQLSSRLTRDKTSATVIANF